MTFRHTLLIPLLALPLGACIINVDSHEERHGRMVGPTTLEQIEPGKNQDYVLALLGEPTSRAHADGGTEIWKWEYSVRKTREGTLLFVFADESSTTAKGATYVELKDGVVVRRWQD